MICVCCGDKNVVDKFEFIRDDFDGIFFNYVEEYMHCLECGFSFVTAKQSSDNLERRIKSTSRRKTIT